jgi:NADPH-dependent curcumin reductase CurA
VTGARVIGVAGGAAKCQNLKDLGFDVAIDHQSGARVIGVAGGAAKCQNLKDLGFDVAIDHQSQNVDVEIKKGCSRWCHLLF